MTAEAKELVEESLDIQGLRIEFYYHSPTRRYNFTVAGVRNAQSFTPRETKAILKFLRIIDTIASVES